jgi:hypothetical protein
VRLAQRRIGTPEKGGGPLMTKSLVAKINRILVLPQRYKHDAGRLATVRNAAI